MTDACRIIKYGQMCARSPISLKDSKSTNRLPSRDKPDQSLAELRPLVRVALQCGVEWDYVSLVAIWTRKAEKKRE
ncbi:hypothetical protein RRG08_050532 [Elysia crispata]|uniref:Uncharacterized protein n=1 Tax=Elysia crispata TaxID=231223 RepID=A0AAE1DMA8_9GAST|nr:hypothetical protein RRG08_050532 [Elysia crispata]